MNREQFMKQLSYLLQDISDEDRTDALDYYENYLDEAGFGYETDITNELGSPERIAAIIRTSLLSNPDETGEFTDSGYENSRFKDPGYELAKQHRETDTFTGADRSKHPYTSCGSESGKTYGQAQQSRSSFHPGAERSGPRTSRLLKLLLWIVLLIVGAPLLLGIGGSIEGLTAAIVGIAFALLISLGVLTGGAFITAILALPLGIVSLFIHPVQGIFTAGTGLAALGAGFLLLALCLLFYGRLIPRLICRIIDWISGMLHKGRSQR